MAKTLGQEVALPNPTLAEWDILVGEWHTVGTHPMMPGVTVHGRTSFAWLEVGAFLIMHSEIDQPDIPSGIAIFGSDDSQGEYSMLYFDERGVSRRYEASLKNHVWKWWRNTPDFSQRFTGTIAEDGRMIVAKGELSRDGSTWEGDLDLTYRRAR